MNNQIKISQLPSAHNFINQKKPHEEALKKYYGDFKQLSVRFTSN